MAESDFRKYAFTLAEILITLAIIGVVAALTIPSVVQNYQKHQTVVRLKKAYAQLHQAINLSEVDNGDLSEWNYSYNNQAFYDRYLKKYLKVSKSYGSSSQDVLGVSYKFLNGQDIGSGYEVNSIASRAILNDGSMLFFGSGTYDKLYKHVYIDINGTKKPNQFGKDVFMFVIQPHYKVSPLGLGNVQETFGFGDKMDRDLITGSSAKACKKGGEGWWCSALIMVDGWEIKDDYPW